jgi:outer membrane usher protein
MATSVPGAWGRSVRFGGVQYSTNFATQPGYITFPSIASGGQAALPSTVDVFVNNALVAQKTVLPGPFSITNIPTVNGSGNVRLVVRDLFGREQVISQPFYASVNLLKAGLEDFSYEAGVERSNFGTESGDYGHAVASATYRRGLTGRLTGEIRGEASRDLGVAGIAAGYLIENSSSAADCCSISRCSARTVPRCTFASTTVGPFLRGRSSGSRDATRSFRSRWTAQRT